ncbi:ATPase family AAA domain-containing protein 5 [Nothoprocta perdicaria]|uniref:ATPase family AAA domain-containing protein 5 n=1 Tax=Nothoprocta perdicaria TaxID=30464 RepID=UPI000E1C0F72|nr:ATPase family AAA domain-containing protein 5 [Nothoprocta perdicaria]
MKESENDCVIAINSDDSSRETTGPRQDANDFTATSTSVHQNCAKELVEDGLQSENISNNVMYRKNAKKVGSEINAVKNSIRKSRKRKHKVNMDLSESFSSENQMNENPRKEPKDKKKMVSPKIECEVTISDSSFEAQMDDKPSQVNESVITVSFEDFLKSQGEDGIDHGEAGTKLTLDNSVRANETVKTDGISDPEKCEEQQPLLKTVTVLAQIHSVPPKLPSLRMEHKASRKLASIFLRQKGCVGEKESSLPPSENEQTEQTTQKRKSNVVIEEEDLELAVLETAGSESSRSKCSAEERHQFMKAFRQPPSDVIKTGVKKAPGKPKQTITKPSKEVIEGGALASNRGLESEITEDYVDKHSPSSPENNRTKTKRAKKLQKNGNGQKKALKSKEISISKTNDPSKDACSEANVHTEDSGLDVRVSSSPKVNELRRSLRKKKIETSKTVTPKKDRIKNTLCENELSDSPLQTSTPKANKKSLKKNNVYKAEVITVPFEANSPIRMRFTRINATKKLNKAEAMKNEELAAKNIKMSSTSKNISKAKQLVEKAKARQHNRARAKEDSMPVRRSSRQQALAEKKKLHDTDESVIILDSSLSDITAATHSMKQKQKNLRNLNDVLGKKSQNMKVTKNSNGKPSCPPSFLGKNVKKSVDEPIIIFDESSQDASENSQDGDQFRAKREFLMSGLPELLKRQIAKKAAVLEAYSVASSSFKTVVHVQQKDECYPLWKLKSPSCPILTKLRKLNTEVTNVTNITISLGEFSTMNTKLCGNPSAPVFSNQRTVFPEIFRKHLLDEIMFSNSQFPVRKYFYKLLKKQAEQLLFGNNLQENNNSTVKSEVNQKRSENWKEAKRKRKETEDHKSKRRKRIEDSVAEMKSKVARNVSAAVGGKTEAETGLATCAEENKTQKANVVREGAEASLEPNVISGGEKEDVLWTEKYQPQDSSELVGNKKEIEKLHSWLKEWKKRADWEEKRNQKRAKEDKEHEDSLDSLDFKDDKSDIEEETSLCNTVLITGPPGVGKTAAVYACAQELGFKIFEVNASCQRSGRQILSQLKEATQSHQVDKKGVNAHKPCFFNSCSSVKSPKKIYSPKKALSPRRPPLSPRGAKRSLPPKTLANYFKISSKRKNNDEIIPSQEKVKENNQDSCEEKKDAEIKSVNKEVEGGEDNRKSATSLILFEEVDIIFDEDAGFLNAIKTFMATAKRPVVLTTNDPTFSLMFDGYFEEINFRTPSLVNAASYLQVLCLAENLRTDVKDLAALLTTNNCDIRQSVLFLQFWIRSGGGYLKEKHLALHGGDETSKTDEVLNSEKTTDSKTDSSQADTDLWEIPKCDTGCVETLLGLKNILLPSEDLFTFLQHKITTMDDWNKLIRLLTEFQMKKVDFIYSNLEFILPLPVHFLPKQSETSNPILLERTTVVSSNNKTINSSCTGKSSAGKKAKKIKNQKRLDILDDSDLFDTGLNYSAEFITLPSDTPISCIEENKEELKLMDKEEKTEIKRKTSEKSCAVVFQCLNSLTEFVENMSFLDCCINTNTKEPLEFSKDEGFNWTNGKIKNGLSDEFSVENTDWWCFQSCSELKATIEALSFYKCSHNISKDLEASLGASKTPKSEELDGLVLPLSNTRNHVSFSQAADSSIHKKAQKRQEVIRTVFSRTPLNLGNKQASIVEYLPTLRNICRSEKLKEQGKTKRRFLHYLEGIHLEISRQTINSLSFEFP